MKKFINIRYGNVYIKLPVIKVNGVEMIRTPAGFLVPVSHFKSR